MKKLTIIQTADIHGNIADYAYVAAYVKKLRASGEPVLVVDSGDIFRGSILSEYSNGMVTAEIMNEIGYDFMVFGNDEHFGGLEEINAMRTKLNFPVLGALSKQADGTHFFDAYGVKQLGGFTIGAIGLEASFSPGRGPMGPGPQGAGPGGPMPGGGGPGGPGPNGPMPGEKGPGATAPNGFDGPVSPATGQKRGNELEEVQNAERELRKLGCDFLMVISHMGVDDTYMYPAPKLARDVPTLDLIADGHSHHALPEGIQEGNVLVTQPADHLGSFVHTLVTEDDEGHREKTCHLVTMEWCRQNLTPDAAVEALLETERQKVQAATTAYCDTPFLLDGGRPQIRQRETNLGDVVCDAILFSSGAEISICGGGAIRASLQPGPITNFDVASVFANGGNLGLYQCKGQWILDQMERSLSSYPTQAPAFLQIGGFRITFSAEKEAGNRILTATLDNGEALDPNRIYTVAKELGMQGPNVHSHQKDSVDCVKMKEIGTLEQAFINYLSSGKAVLFENAAGRLVAK